MAVIDSAYHYYLSTYGNSSVSRYDTHKKSQLRAVYNDMVKTNKEAPLYKITNTSEVKRFAIDIKERARSIQHVVAALSDSGSGIESAFGKKIAQSSDESIVSAEYIGSNKDISASPEFEIEVKTLATPQINLGEYLTPDKSDIKPGTYSFHLYTSLSSYEFEYSIGERDTNLDIQEKIVRLINNSGVDIYAKITSNDNGRNAIRIESRQTGLGSGENFQFELMPSSDPASAKALRTLGIANVSEMPRNSSFLLNGAERTSYSNTFTVNNAFELTLNNTPPEGGTTHISFKADADAIADNIQSLVNVYNNIIQLGHNYADTQKTGRLLYDMGTVAKDYYNELEAIGLKVTENSYISMDRSLLTDAVTAEDAKECFSVLNEFKDSLSQKASHVSIDPMNYVSKIVVAYKNPGHNFVTPYISSIYSGMMLDFQC